MSGNDKNTSLYSASDIQKYLRGELSAPEMHQLELAALEDPFLSDALEGMGIHHSLPAPLSFQQDLGELQQRLDDRVGKKESKRGILSRSSRKAAAAVILLAGLGLTAYFASLTSVKIKKAEAVAQSSQRSPVPAAMDSIALEDRAVATQQPEAKDSKKEVVAAAPRKDFKTRKPTGGTLPRETPHPATEPVVPADTIGDIAQAAPATADKETYNSSKKRAQITNDLYKADQVRLDSSHYLHKQAPSLTTTTQTAPSSTTVYNVALERTSGMNITSFAEQLVFTGKVIDQNKNPLPGAALYLAGRGNYNYAFNTITDKNGFFSLKLPKIDSAFKLTVASVGYEQTSLGLSVENRTGNVIQLQPQPTALNEVVVTGFGAKRKETITDNSKPKKDFLTKKAIPADGWPAYQSYLEVNKKILNPDSTLKGNETISFIVNKEGALSSFKVEQSLSPAHDSAAIRLIRQGPSWKLLEGKKTRAWVTILF